MQRARRADSGPAGEEHRGWALPEPTPPWAAARSRGDSWARQSFAAAAGRHPRHPCFGPPAAPSRALRLQHPEERRAQWGAAAKPQNSGSPQRPSLADLGIPICFPVLRAGATAAIAAFSTLWARLEQEKDDPLDLPAKSSHEIPVLLTGRDHTVRARAQEPVELVSQKLFLSVFPF